MANGLLRSLLGAARGGRSAPRALAVVSGAVAPFLVPVEWSPKRRLVSVVELAEAEASLPRVAALVGDVRAVRSGAGAVAAARRALELVQRLPYVPDPPGDDTHQGAEYTATRGGDCEDLSALLWLRFTRGAGLRARVLWLEQRGAALSHVTSQALAAGQWEWAEACVAGARFGEYPYDAVRRLGAGVRGLEV